jgi:putative ABC transport system ATP-binding protein
MASTVGDRARPAHTARFTIDGGAGLTPDPGAWVSVSGSPAVTPCDQFPTQEDLMIDHSTSGDVIRLADVTKAYASDGLPALAGVSMDVAAGEVVAVMGPSGSGKSTLLNLIAGLDRPTTGTVTVAGRRIDALGESALARFRARHIGIIFQFFNLLDDLTVEDNVLLPAQLAGASRRQARARAGALLERMGISDFRDAYPARMSGGQRQRVAIARALVNEPEVLLADEPTGALDTATGQEIGRLLRDLNRGGQTLVLVTHDADLAERYAARMVRIVDGRISGGVGAGVLR